MKTKEKLEMNERRKKKTNIMRKMRKKKKERKRRKRTDPASVRWELKIINQIESQMGWW